MKKDKIKVLFASPEVMPYAATGGLGEVAGSLPMALDNAKKPEIDARVIVPLYGMVKDDVRKKMRFLGYKNIPVAWRNQYMGVFELKENGVTYYFIDNEYYFKRDGLYGFGDDCERFAFFSRAVLEAEEFTGFSPDIIHANDWQTAAVPVFLKTFYKNSKAKTVFTVHNIEYQGQFGDDVTGDVLGLSKSEAKVLRHNGGINLMKGAITLSDSFTTVSPTYARELMGEESAFGLHQVVRDNEYKLRGILNGIGYDAYDPSNDKFISSHYSVKSLGGKARCRKALQKEVGLPEKNVPVITLISRLVAPKGLDLVTGVMGRLLSDNDIQFVMLGTGDENYENYFRALQGEFPDKVAALIDFNTPLAHRIYAGGDILLMPSRSEPCGLAQMIGARYGDIPVIRQTGGLADSITEWDGEKGEGFTFFDFDAGELGRAIERALSLAESKRAWNKLVRNAMATDFSWERSAKEYEEMYKGLLGRK